MSRARLLGGLVVVVLLAGAGTARAFENDWIGIDFVVGASYERLAADPQAGDARRALDRASTRVGRWRSRSRRPSFARLLATVARDLRPAIAYDTQLGDDFDALADRLREAADAELSGLETAVRGLPEGDARRPRAAFLVASGAKHLARAGLARSRAQRLIAVARAMADDRAAQRLFAGTFNIPSWWRDSDGDGWGDPNAEVLSPAQPAGYAPNWFDCRDASASVHPGAADPANGVDDDCDGSLDEDP